MSRETCRTCGCADAAYRCSACSTAVYCSHECQRRAWRDHYRDECTIGASIQREPIRDRAIAFGTYVIYDLLPVIVTRSNEVPLTVDEQGRSVPDRRFQRIQPASVDARDDAAFWLGDVTFNVNGGGLEPLLRQLQLPLVVPTVGRDNRPAAGRSQESDGGVVDEVQFTRHTTPPPRDQDGFRPL